MARLVTLTVLQNRVLQRANLEHASNSALVTAGELLDNINEGIAELYDLISEVEGQPFYLESATFNTTSTTDTYTIGAGQAVPITDFYRMRGLDILFGQNIVNTARPFMWAERNRYKMVGGWTYSMPVAYRLLGKSSAVAQSGNDSIKLMPAPGGAFSCTLWYTPTPPVLVNPSDAFDGINGFEELVVLSAAIKLLSKQEQLEHASFLMGQLQLQQARIRGMAGERDAENPSRIIDVQASDELVVW